LTPVVLYIDDSGVERRIVQRLLEDDGFRVFTAEKAEEGLEMAARVRPDMILLDLHLEGTEGCQLAERLREMPGLEKVPIVAISASLKDEERPEVLERFDGYVQKPVDVDLFPRMVREFMWQGAREGHPPVQGLPSGKGIAVSPSGGRRLAGVRQRSRAGRGKEKENALPTLKPGSSWKLWKRCARSCPMTCEPR
jgi:CheY-like chemotaxis protein